MKVNNKDILNLLNRSKRHIETVFGKTTVVTIELPCGYTLTAASGCVDPRNYDLKVGCKICFQHIENKLWSLEGYVLQVKHPVGGKLR